MQPISDEFRKLIKNHVKVGPHEMPVCIVEVDRMVFVPGRVEEIQYLVGDPNVKTVQDSSIIGEGETIPTDGIVFPVKGKTLADVGSKFGMRLHPIDHVWKMHTGVDIGAPQGTPILAAWGGTVKKAGWQNGYGNTVIIDHGHGYYTRYGHMCDNCINVKEGTIVKSGQEIGAVGSTGKSTKPHLHFEVLYKGVDPATSYARDPLPYLQKKQTVPAPVQNTGPDVVTQTPITFSLGAMAFSATFDLSKWASMPELKLPGKEDFYFKGLNPKVTGIPVIYFEFDPAKMLEEGLSTAVGRPLILNLDLEKRALLDVSFLTNFVSDSGDSFSIMVNGVTKAVLKKFKPGATVDRLSDILLEAGKTEIQFVVYWHGPSHPQDKVLKRFGFKSINVRYVNEIVGQSQSQSESDDPTLIARSLANVFNPTRREKISLPVGDFVPAETIRLDNVKEVEIDDKFEMEAAEARIIMSNPKGFYSSTYDTGLFPELRYETPFSYTANGVHMGLLSENTPIRIHMGYGRHTIRVFTGLIDKVDSNSEEETITITCRNMYKRLIEKVVTEDLEYGYSASDASVANVAAALNDGTDVDNLSRLKKIIYYAQKWAKHYGVDPIVILAVAQKETELGTTGAGREVGGDYICGYGVPSKTKKLPQFAGIEAQCKAVAERMKKVCGTGEVTREYIRKLWISYENGDPTWTPDVWSIYQKMKGDAQFTEAVFKADSAPVPSGNTSNLSVNIKQNLLRMNPKSRSGKKLKGVKGIVLHYTAGPGQSAEQIRNYFNNISDRYASANYVVDDSTIVQCIPDDEEAYHCGAEHYQPGVTDALGNHPNETTLGIEMCVDSNNQITAATYQNAVNLTAYLCKKYGLTAGQLWRHHDITGKDCPAPWVDDPSKWEKFKKDVAAKLDGQGVTTVSAQEAAGLSSYWLKSAILQDLIRVGGLVGWRKQYEDRIYPDSIIEETYYIDVKPEKRMVVKANPAENGEYTFSEIPLTTIKTIDGWKNGLYQLPTTFSAFKYKVNECIREITKDTNYRTWCDRYGTFRAEPVEYDSPVVERFTDMENLCAVSSSIDYSRARSHVIVVDGTGKARHYIDPEILLELKGELRSAVLEVSWAKTDEQKDEDARRVFWDMKRMCRTLQVSIPAHPHLDVLDCIHISDVRTCTRGDFTIKGIHTTFKEGAEFTQTLDLTWMETNEMITKNNARLIASEAKQA
ncbi:N-acetylmuramoyl-L-alanine amidase [Aneurinibacillus soli]|uniref:Murein DD-endopeptidase MepM n=1 Tax=Aneurinibacillus soli TaxID=1500254 RepID=A0A0U5AWN6_9BACL|nr:peptidoglycan DD-metalloendopeptidase family protein [Aneurinibacillus soli]PYE64216.1 N-acetylmuramoyl-L-alanine amidase [Aneurinibacillus soli]BAU28165.1 Murein DD-endopeptidase MepM [Aneurinibacillus soli]